jgi:TolB-like protein
LAGLLQPRDDRPPVLQVSGWKESQTVYMPNVVLTGSVSDRDQVVSLSINGEPLLPKPGALFFFAHIVNLAPGINTVTIEAEDATGNRAQRRLIIERKIPKGLLLEERLRLSVFAFEQKGRLSPASFAFQDDFIHEILGHRRFQVVERQRLDLILQEHKISQTQLIDTDTAVRLGNLAAAQAAVAGSLVETRTGIEIIARVIDTETAEILCAADVYGENKTLPGLKFLARALTLKLLREFPLVDGLVIDKKGDLIITDLTLEKLRAQRRLLVYAEHPVVHPDTNQALGMDHEVLGGARVTQADDNLAKARLKPDSNPLIQPRHRVITQ